MSTPPSLPPLSEEEKRADKDISRRLQKVARELQQRNLDRAVIPAQPAAAGCGPLVDHFAELGRRYAHLLKTPQKPKLRLVGG